MSLFITIHVLFSILVNQLQLPSYKNISDIFKEIRLYVIYIYFFKKIGKDKEQEFCLNNVVWCKYFCFASAITNMLI